MQNQSDRQQPVQLAFVVPCYNEADVLPLSLPKLLACLESLQKKYCTPNSYILLVDDGSSDQSWSIIEAMSQQHPQHIRALRLACNVGHQYALMAGLTYAHQHCDIAISIDADLQDNLDVIATMIEKYLDGAEIVLGVKQARSQSDNWFKRVSASSFYDLMKVMGVKLTKNHADFRLLSAKALGFLQQFEEYNLFLRGLSHLLHQRIDTVHYVCSQRQAGESKYSLAKMLSLAWNGITSFSVVPLRLITLVGCFISVVSLIFAVYALIEACSGNTLPGWASITVPLYLLGGAIILSLGIVGEYIAKLFMEVKKRPRFLIDTTIERNNDE